MNFKGRRQSLLLLLLLGFGRGFVSAAVSGTSGASVAARSSHWLEKYSPLLPITDAEVVPGKALPGKFDFPAAVSPGNFSTWPATLSAEHEKARRRNGQEETADPDPDPDPLKRKIDWGRVREVVFGSENMVQVVTAVVATKVVMITGYVLAGKSSFHREGHGICSDIWVGLTLILCDVLPSSVGQDSCPTAQPALPIFHQPKPPN